jgi:hypothetical protein
MRRITILLLALVTGSSYAAEEFICPPDKRIGKFAGYYAHMAIVKSAPRLRLWPAILKTTEPYAAGLTIKNDNVFLSLAWHESDMGGHCIKQDAQGIWVREYAPNSIVERPLLGPYKRIATLTENEALAYLTLFMDGCYKSSDSKRWCFSRTGVTVDGAPFGGEFELDTIELPKYGTSFNLSKWPLPLLVFEPTKQGWAAYRDDVVTSESTGHVPVFTLTKEGAL